MSDTNTAGTTGHETPAGADAPPTGVDPAAVVPPAEGLPEMPAEATLVREGSVPAPRPDRELEAAPRLLQNAAWILLGGALFPFMGANGGLLSSVAAKLVGLVGCGLLAAAVYTRLPQPVPFGLGVLGNVRFVKPPEPGKKPKGAAALFASVPTALHLVGLLLLVAAVALPYLDPVIAKAWANYVPDTGMTPPQASSFKAAAEVLALLLAGCTLAHLFAYRKGGHFSPLYPFLFAGPALMGVLSVYTQFTVAERKNALAIIGALTVVVAAGIGVYTIVMAMVQAKKEGDAKRQAALEARRAARKSSGSGSKAGAPRRRS